MASTIQELKLAALAGYAPADRIESYQQIYESNRHRVYALAFWMTDNEITADELMGHVFRRAFAHSAQPSPEAIDRALIAELRGIATLGTLTLADRPAKAVLNVRRNILRTHLERAIVQVPATERLIFMLHDVEGYPHARIARLLGLNEAESQTGLHRARLYIRELVAKMQN